MLSTTGAKLWSIHEAVCMCKFFCKIIAQGRYTDEFIIIIIIIALQHTASWNTKKRVDS